MSDQEQSKAAPAESDPRMDRAQPDGYQIRVKSHLDPDWTDWFDGLTITLEPNGDMLLTGPVVDQAALHGLLKKVRDLGMSLVSINPLPIDETSFEKETKK